MSNSFLKYFHSTLASSGRSSGIISNATVTPSVVSIAMATVVLPTVLEMSFPRPFNSMTDFLLKPLR